MKILLPIVKIILLIATALACISVAPCAAQSKDQTIDDLAAHIESGWDLAEWLSGHIEYVSERDSRSGLNRDRFVPGNETLKNEFANCRAFAILECQVMKLKGYEHHILISSPESGEGHAICAFKKGEYYNYFSNTTYHKVHAKTLGDVAHDAFDQDEWDEFDDTGYIIPK